MPARLADGMARVQATRAVAARLRREIDDRIHPLHGHQGPMVSRMARLPAGVTSTLQATSSLPLSTRETIGGRRLRSDGGILLFQRELPLEIRNPLRVLLKLLAQSFIFLAQSFDLLRLAITRVTRWLVTSQPLLAPSRHRRELTKPLQKVQVRNHATYQRT
jgi:hypothetical protein